MGSERRVPAREALVAVAIAVALVAACGGEGAAKVAPPSCDRDVEPGTRRVDVEGGHYLRRVPFDHGVRPMPLVVALHGYSERAELHVETTGLADYGDAHGFVTVTPQRTADIPRWDLQPDGADAGLLAAVIDDAVATLCIDDARVYVVGMSMGGFMVSALACGGLSSRLAAMAAVAGVRDVEPCDPRRAVPALVLHGTDDGTVPIDGGLHPMAAEAMGLPEAGPPIKAIVDRWRARTGAEITFEPLDGVGHVWPADANETVWTFLRSRTLSS